MCASFRVRVHGPAHLRILALHPDIVDMPDIVGMGSYLPPLQPGRMNGPRGPAASVHQGQAHAPVPGVSRPGASHPGFLSSLSLIGSLHMPTCHMTLFSVTHPSCTPFYSTLLFHPLL